MSSIPATHVIQVTNVAPAATLQQMRELFGFLGRITDIKLYPSENCVIEPQSRVCYVEYDETWSVGVAQHLTNTVFIDRALIVVPIADEGIPSESTALALTNPSSALPGLVSSGPNALINEISGVDGSLVITTVDPKLTALGLPQYPPLPANLEPVKIEEIRRTVTVGNLDSSVSADNLLKYFNHIGEVKFLRMGGDGIETAKFALVEFTDQSSVSTALQYNGATFEGRKITIYHATRAIIKPSPKSSETAQKEIEEAMKRVREAQSLISAVIEPELAERERSRHHTSHSRSRSHARSTSPSHSRRKRSRSRSKRSRSHSNRSRSRSKRSRSRSKRSRSRRRSWDRHVSRTPSRRYSKCKSRTRSRDRKKLSPHYKKGRSRSISRDRKKVSPRYKKGRSRSRSRGRSKRQRRSKSRSPSKSRSRKLRRSKEKEEGQELERTSREKEQKSGKNFKDVKSRSNLSKENSRSSELYGPSLPVPKENACSKEYSKSPVRCNKSSKSHSRSPERHNKYQSSKSQSRSPLSSKREKYKRTQSRSLSKESSSSYRNKSRSASKHRSRSRSQKRSRSRSKVSNRRKQPSPRHRYGRRNSRSITPSRKRGSYSHKRYSLEITFRRRKSGYSSSRKRSSSPRRKSRSPRRESKAPVRHSTSPKHRSPSLSPRIQSSPSRRYRSSKSPEMRSPSLSPDSILIKEKEKEYLEEKAKLAALFASSDEGENIGETSPSKIEEEVRKLEKQLFSNVNEHQFGPSVAGNDYYNNNDMDLGSNDMDLGSD